MVNEVFVRSGSERPVTLVLAATLMGLPAFLRGNGI
jgi:hypothetical protein